MELLGAVGTIAAICTTGAFVPQIVKIRKQGGEDLSWAMLGVYFVGVALWLAYGLMIHASAVIWANAITMLLVAVAMALKATHAAGERSPGKQQNAAAKAVESEVMGD
jgi:MtN3 and saliva related transmembrane protein